MVSAPDAKPRISLRGWIEFQDKDGKVVDADTEDFKKIYAKLAIGQLYVQERLPLHLLKLSEAKQDQYLTAVNEKLTKKLAIGLARKGISPEVISHVAKMQAAQQQLEVMKEARDKGIPLFKFEEAG